jgi:hypothetical protein
MIPIIAVLLFVIILGAYIYLILPRGAWRVLAVSIYVVLTASVFGGASELIGLSKPVLTEWRTLEGSEIIAFVPVEGEAIHVWILRDGTPVAYALPWSVKDAQLLQDGLKRMGEQGGTLELGERFDGTPDADQQQGDVAKEVPPTALPSKE